MPAWRARSAVLVRALAGRDRRGRSAATPGPSQPAGDRTEDEQVGEETSASPPSPAANSPISAILYDQLLNGIGLSPVHRPSRYSHRTHSLGRIRGDSVRPSVFAARIDGQKIVREYQRAGLNRHSIKTTTIKPPQASVLLQVGEAQLDRPAALLVSVLRLGVCIRWRRATSRTSFSMPLTVRPLLRGPGAG